MLVFNFCLCSSGKTRGIGQVVGTSVGVVGGRWREAAGRGDDGGSAGVVDGLQPPGGVANVVGNPRSAACMAMA